MGRLLANDVSGVAARRAKLAISLKAGIISHTDHTGLCTEEIAAKALQAEGVKRGLCDASAGFRHHRGCDIKPSSLVSVWGD